MYLILNCKCFSFRGKLSTIMYSSFKVFNRFVFVVIVDFHKFCIRLVGEDF